MINKVVKSIQEAIAGVRSDMIFMVGGFGLSGIPENCIAALSKKDIFNLTCISNNAGVEDFGLGLLLQRKQIKKMISFRFPGGGVPPVYRVGAIKKMIYFIISCFHVFLIFKLWNMCRVIF